MVYEKLGIASQRGSTLLLVLSLTGVIGFLIAANWESCWHARRLFSLATVWDKEDLQLEEKLLLKEELFYKAPIQDKLLTKWLAYIPDTLHFGSQGLDIFEMEASDSSRNIKILTTYGTRLCSKKISQVGVRNAQLYIDDYQGNGHPIDVNLKEPYSMPVLVSNKPIFPIASSLSLKNINPKIQNRVDLALALAEGLENQVYVLEGDYLSAYNGLGERIFHQLFSFGHSDESSKLNFLGRALYQEQGFWHDALVGLKSNHLFLYERHQSNLKWHRLLNGTPLSDAFCMKWNKQWYIVIFIWNNNEQTAQLIWHDALTGYIKYTVNLSLPNTPLTISLLTLNSYEYVDNIVAYENNGRGWLVALSPSLYPSPRICRLDTNLSNSEWITTQQVFTREKFSTFGLVQKLNNPITKQIQLIKWEWVKGELLQVWSIELKNPSAQIVVRQDIIFILNNDAMQTIKKISLYSGRTIDSDKNLSYAIDNIGVGRKTWQKVNIEN